MMQHLFLTHSGFISPRWQLAFPRAQILEHESVLPSILLDTLLWVVSVDILSPDQLSAWVARGARVVVLTPNEDPQQAKQVISYGASGYLHYLAAASVLEQVGQVVQLGGLWLGADLLRQLVFFTATINKPDPRIAALSVLTLREKVVAEAVTGGKSNKEIAADLAITERTVKAHLSAVFEKLKIRDRLQLVLVMTGK